MSRSIDQRVVQMQFDNAKFEKGVKETVKSLGELKESLELDDATKSLERLSKTASSFSLENIADNIQSLSDRFSTMGIIGMNVISNLTNRFVNMASSMVRSLTIDQINSGMSKYEQKMQSVQTIMNATEMTANQVGVELARLQQYTDETSYHYDELVGAISKFTSAGKGLNESVTAIQGIANAAALAGVGVNGASSAFYNFSQAMSKGAMKYDDWKSIEGLNMATGDLKKTLIQAGLAVGTLQKKTVKGVEKIYVKGKKMQVTTANFGQTLSTAWLTGEALVKGLGEIGDNQTEIGAKAYAAAQKALTWTDAIGAIKEAISSGWSTSFETIFGDVTEASEMWTNFCNNIIELVAPFSEARNEMLGEWKLKGGRGDLLAGFRNLYDVIVNIKDAIGDTFTKFDIGISADTLLDISSGFRRFTETLKDLFTPISTARKEFREFGSDVKNPDSGSGIKTLRYILFGLGAAFDIVRTAVQAVWGGLQQLWTAISPITSVFGTIIYDLSMGVQWLAQYIKENNIFGIAVQAVVNVLSPVLKQLPGLLLTVWNAAKTFFTGLAKGIDLDKIKEKIASFSSTIGGWIGSAVTWVTNLWQSFKESETAKKLLEKVTAIFDGFKKTIKSAYSTVKNFFSTLFGKKEDKKTPIGNTIDNLAAKIKAFIAGPLAWIKEKIASVKEFLKPISATFSQFTEDVSKQFQNFMADPLKWIGDKYAALKAKLQPYLDTLGAFKDGLCQKIKNFLADPKKALDDIAQQISAFFSDPMSYINKWIGTISKWATDAWAKIVEVFTGLFGSKDEKATDEAVAEAQAKDSLFDRILKAVQDSWNWVSTGLTNVFNGVSTFWKNNKGWILPLAGLIAVVVVIVKIFKKIMGFVHDLATLKGAKTNESEKTKQSLMQIGGGLLMIAGAIGVLVYCLAYLGNMDTNALKQGAVALGGVMLALLVFTGLLTLMKADKLFTAIGIMGAGILGIALAIRILISCFAAIDKINNEQLKRGFIVLAGLMIGMAAMIMVIGKSGDGGSWQAAIEIVAVAIAIRLIINSLKSIQDATPSQLGNMLGTMVVLSLCIAGMIAVIGWASKSESGTKNKSMVMTLVALALVIWILIQTLKPIAKMKPEEFERMETILITLGAAISAMMFMIALAGKWQGDNATATWVSIIAVALLIRVLGNALKEIKDVPMENVISFLGGIVLMLFALAVVFKASEKVDNSKMALTALAMVAACAMLYVASKALKRIKNVKMSTILAFLGGLALMIVALGVMLLLCSKTNPANIALSSLVIVAAAALMIAAAYAFKMIENVKMDNIVGFVTALGIVLVQIVAVIAILGLIPGAAVVQGLLAIAAIGAIVIGLVALAAEILSDKIVSLGAALELVSEMLTSFTEAMGSISDDGTKSASDKFAELFGIILKAPSTEQTDAFSKFASTLSISAYAVAAFFDKMSQVSIDQTAMESAMGALGSMASLMTTSTLPTGEQVTAFKKYAVQLPFIATYVSDFASAITTNCDAGTMETAKAIMDKVKETIDVLALLIPYAQNKGLTDVETFLAEVGGAIALYNNGLVKMETGSTDVEANTTAALKLVGALVKGLEDSDLMGSLNLVPSETNLSAFGLQLMALGGALDSYVQSVAGISAETIQPSIDALGIIAGLNTQLAATQAVLAYFGVEGNPLGDFSTNLYDLGIALSLYADSVAGVNVTKVRATGRAMEIIAQLERHLTVDAVVVKLFGTGNPLETFSTNLVLLGGGLASFAYETQEIDETKLNTAINAVKVLARLNNLVPTTGGVLGIVMGDKSFSKFATGLTALGGGVKIFAEKTEKVDTGKVTACGNALTVLADMNSRLPNVKGLKQWIDGAPNLTQFSSDIGLLGEGLNKFATNIPNLDADKVSAATACLDFLVNLNDRLPEIGGLFQKWFTGEKDLGEFAGDLPALGKGLTEFANACKDADSTGIENAKKMITPIASLLRAFSSCESYNMSSLAYELEWTHYNGHTIGESIKLFLENVGTVSPGTAEKNIGVINSLLTMLSKHAGLKDGNIDISGVNEAIAKYAELDMSPWTTAADTAQQEYSVKFETVGTNIGYGLAKGIRSGNSVFAAVTAAIALAKAAYTAACNWLGIKSPSRAFADIGMYTDLGFAQGINNYSKVVESAAGDLGDTALNSASNAVSNFSDVFSQDLETDPVITPVVDMTNVENGSQRINNLLGGTNGLSVNALGGVTLNNKANDALNYSVESDETVKEILNTVSTFGERLDMLAEQFGNMQLILDTGILAGQLTDKIDEGLGYRMLQIGRGG